MQSIYNKYLKDALFNYYDEDTFKKHYNRVPLMRDETFNYCIDYFKDRKIINIVEL